jgi:Tol biopolymer transport system component
MAADGTEKTLLAATDRHDGAPTWSPDGRTIAFVAGAPPVIWE